MASSSTGGTATTTVKRAPIISKMRPREARLALVAVTQHDK